MTYWVAGAAVLGAGVSMYEGSQNRKAANESASGSSDASKYAANLQNQQYMQTRQDQMPWLDTGKTALSRLSYLMGMGGNGLKTREQLAAELAPQFTKGGNSLSGYVAGPNTNVNPLLNTAFSGGNLPQGYGGAQTAASMSPAQIDQAGLNAAVEKAYAAQHVDPAYGSLSRNFSNADFVKDPGYQFRLEQGQNAVDNSFAAKGGLLSGAALKAAMRYNQGFASNEYGNVYNRFVNNQTNQYNRLASLAHVGQTAAGTLGDAGANYAGNLGNLAMTNAANQGNAMLVGAQSRASGYQGAANALGKVDWSKLFSSSGGSGYGGDSSYTDSFSSPSYSA